MGKAELILIRHGVTDSPGTLNGRTDVGLAETPSQVSLELEALYVSPAKRAVATAKGLFPGVAQIEDPRLWEQNFGAWDGMPFADVPDVGPLSRDELAGLKAEGGESFAEMVARARSALVEIADVSLELGGLVGVVAHAGTVRAALAVAMGDVPGALAFEVAHLGATRLRVFEGGLAVKTVNEVLL